MQTVAAQTLAVAPARLSAEKRGSVAALPRKAFAGVKGASPRAYSGLS